MDGKSVNQARIRFRERQDLSPVTLRDAITPAECAKYSEGELDCKTRVYDLGTATTPQLFEVTFAPESGVSVHAHDEDEIIYVLAGEMVVGNRVLGPGASVSIAGKTLYSFKAGPKGLTFLNFRPRVDTTYITREEFLAQQAERKKVQ